MTFMLIALCLAGIQVGVYATSWGYHEEGPDVLVPEFWRSDNPGCGGPAQSPVNIDKRALGRDPALSGLALTGWDELPESLTLKNTGHSAEVEVEGNYTIHGGGLPGVFKVLQFHFHVGSSNGQGSEHSVNGHKYPAEMHIVALNQTYDSVTQAVDQWDGLAVIGVLLRSGQYQNPDQQEAFETIASGFPNITDSWSSVELSPVFPLADILPGDLYPVYRYPGSLTTPGCQQAVTWTLLGNFVRVPNSFLQALRSIQDEHSEYIVDNFRPLQPLNGRQVATWG